MFAVRLQLDEPVSTAPTIGFNVETLQYKNIKFQVRLFMPAVAARCGEQRWARKTGFLNTRLHPVGLAQHAAVVGCMNVTSAGLGSWRPIEHSAVLEVLLPQHGCCGVRGR